MNESTIFILCILLLILVIILLVLSTKKANDKWQNKLSQANSETKQTLSELNKVQQELRESEKELLTTKIGKENLEKSLSDKVDIIEELKDKVEFSEKENNQLKMKISSLETMQIDLVEQKKQLQNQMQEHFENIAQKIFKEREKDWKQDSFDNFNKYLQPFKERIETFEKGIQTQRAEQNKLSGELKGELSRLMEMNKNISQEAQQLSKALKGDNKLQGDWGEYRLETLLQNAGLVEGIHYTKQNQMKDEENVRKIPDFLIHLPDNKSIVLDSKVSLTAYERYFQAENEVDKERAVKNHLLSLKNHIKDLSGKNYHSLQELKTVDYTILFVSIEPALFLAASTDHGLYDFALQNNIVLLSHSTLLATLRTISHIWKQEDQRKNSQQIAEQATKIYNQIASFVEQVDKMGSQLETVRKTHQQLTTKLSGRQGVVGKIERMRKLGLANTKENLIQKYIEDGTSSEEETT